MRDIMWCKINIAILRGDKMVHCVYVKELEIKSER